jgi:surface polysaccharide O-acyltransferase-like enzyme
MESVVHMSTRHTSFHQIDPRRNLYMHLKIVGMKIFIKYIEYILMYMYQSADTIYCDIKYMMTVILMFLLQHHKWITKKIERLTEVSKHTDLGILNQHVLRVSKVL